MSVNVSDLLTIVFTTSPTPSSPSTELLSSVIASFHKHCPALLQCKVTIVFDNYDHITSIPRLKRGQVTAQTAHDYDEYKRNVKQLIIHEFSDPTSQSSLEFVQFSLSAEYGSPGQDDNFVKTSASRTSDDNQKITFLEPAQCLGFSLAVRSALRICQTPYAWIHQHDWTLATDIPLSAMLEIMQAPNTDVPVKYICLPSIRMLSYATQSDVQRFPALRALTADLKRSFVPPSQPDIDVPLTPLFFWYDKPHIALVEHYLARIFPTRYAARRGDFIEDTVGRRARDQMKLGQWHKWACWLYYPDEGRQLCLRHLDGRRWRGIKGELRQKEMYRIQNGVTSSSDIETIEGVATSGELDHSLRLGHDMDVT